MQTVSRPSEYTQETADKICALIAEGKSLTEVCKAEDMPARQTVYQWKDANPSFADAYARAVEDRAERLAEEIIAIADDDSGDYGYKEGSDKDGEGAKPCILQDNIQRAKLRVDARKWTASKLFPKKYGDFQRNEVTGKDGGPIELSIAQQIRAAHDKP